MKAQSKVQGGVGHSRISENEWEHYAGPEADMPARVQFLGESWEDGPWVIAHRLGPNASFGRHAHEYDTIYYVQRGSITFSDNGGGEDDWFGPGDVRWVRGGVEYGPEIAGPDGCDFLLVAYGPHNVQFPDGSLVEGSAT